MAQSGELHSSTRDCACLGHCAAPRCTRQARAWSRLCSGVKRTSRIHARLSESLWSGSCSLGQARVLSERKQGSAVGNEHAGGCARDTTLSLRCRHFAALNPCTGGSKIFHLTQPPTSSDLVCVLACVCGLCTTPLKFLELCQLQRPPQPAAHLEASCQPEAFSSTPAPR